MCLCCWKCLLNGRPTDIIAPFLSSTLQPEWFSWNTNTISHPYSVWNLCVCVCAQLLSDVQLFMNRWTVACQAPLFMEFSRREYWSMLPFPTPGGFPDPGIDPTPLVSPALADGFFTAAPPGKPLHTYEGICEDIHTYINFTRDDSTHWHHQMFNNEIRLIIFFAAKDGEALYSQQKQDQELTVAQNMNFRLKL